MTQMTGPDGASEQKMSVNTRSSRRQLLKIGAATAPAVLTLAPGHAWAASICQVRTTYIVTAPGGGAPYNILPEGVLPEASVPAAQILPPVTLDELQIQALTPLGTNADSAYVAYLNNLMTTRLAGYSCLQSIGYAPR